MMRPMSLCLCLLTVTLVASCPSSGPEPNAPAMAPPAAPPPPPPTVAHQPMTRLLPAGALLMIESSGMDAAQAAFDATDMGHMCAEPAVRQYLEGPGKRLWDALLGMIDKQPGGEKIRQIVTDVLSVVKHRPLALAVTDLTVARGQQMPGKLGVVLLCRPGENEAWGRLTGLLLEAAADKFGKPDKLTVEDAELSWLHAPAGEDGQPPAEAPEVLLGGDGKLAFVIAGSGGVPKDLAAYILRAEAGKPNERISMAQCPVCDRSAAFTHYAGSMLSVYITPASLMNALAPALPEEVVPILDATGLTDINVAQMTLRPEGPDMVVRAYADMDTTRGLGKLYGGAAVTAEDLKLVPADAKYFEVSKANWSGVYDYLKGLLTAVLEQAPKADGDDPLTPARKWLEENEIDLKTDLFDALGDTTVVTDRPAVGVPMLGGLTLVCTVKDPAALRKVVDRCMAALKQALAPPADGGEELPMPIPGMRPPAPVRPKLFGFTNPQVQETVYRGTTLHAVNLLLVCPTLAVTDKHLVFTLSVQAAKEVLDFLAGDGGLRLAEDADRMKALAPLLDDTTGTPVIVAWGENRKAFEDCYNLMLTLAQVASAVAADNGVPFNSADIPPASVLTRHIRPTAAVCRLVKTGFLTQSCGSLPDILPPPVVGLLSAAPGMLVAVRSGPRVSAMHAVPEMEMPEPMPGETSPPVVPEMPEPMPMPMPMPVPSPVPAPGLVPEPGPAPASLPADPTLVPIP